MNHGQSLIAFVDLPPLHRMDVSLDFSRPVSFSFPALSSVSIPYIPSSYNAQYDSNDSKCVLLNVRYTFDILILRAILRVSWDRCIFYFTFQVVDTTLTNLLYIQESPPHTTSSLSPPSTNSISSFLTRGDGTNLPVVSKLNESNLLIFGSTCSCIGFRKRKTLSSRLSRFKFFSTIGPEIEKRLRLGRV